MNRQQLTQLWLYSTVSKPQSFESRHMDNCIYAGCVVV